MGRRRAGRNSRPFAGTERRRLRNKNTDQGEFTLRRGTKVEQRRGEFRSEDFDFGIETGARGNT